MLGAVAFFIDAQGLGIFLREPGRGSGGRSAYYGVDPVLRGGGDGVVQPVQFILAFAGFHAAPGKFAHAHHVDSGLLHQREVGVPARLRPLFRIPRGSQHDWRRWRRLRTEDGG